MDLTGTTAPWVFPMPQQRLSSFCKLGGIDRSVGYVGSSKFDALATMAAWQ